MAEASSSGEESSEEEKHDEASPSLRGPVSPITAASPPHSNKKKLRYVRDYLQRYRSTRDGESKKKSIKAINQVRLQGRSQGGAQGAFAPLFSSMIINFDFLMYKYQH